MDGDLIQWEKRSRVAVDIRVGNCLNILDDLPADHFHTCVTSPPYFGLRDYGNDSQIGREDTPDSFVQNLVDVFRRVRRVLRPDGTLWLNLGDSYAGNSSGGFRAGAGRADGIVDERNQRNRNGLPCPDGFKPKDLMGMPWRVALALQADGWWLRQDIIWHKPNPMPESVTDRCTKSHEYIFLLAKAEKYYFDSQGIREQGVIPAGTKAAKGSSERASQPGVNSRPPEYKIYDGFRNKRSVWTVKPNKTFRGAHFAVYPPELIEPCILAGCPEGGHVLDPFGGAGTTGLVARRLGRNATLIELNPDYAQMARDRIASDD
jgi:site-specific DNA-methyltransferase (adenine-specific)